MERHVCVRDGRWANWAAPEGHVAFWGCPGQLAAPAGHENRTPCHVSTLGMLYLDVTFEEFASTVGVRLRAGLVAAYGPDLGLDVAAEALAYGWEHWGRSARWTTRRGISTESGKPQHAGFSVGMDSFRCREHRHPGLRTSAAAGFGGAHGSTAAVRRDGPCLWLGPDGSRRTARRQPLDRSHAHRSGTRSTSTDIGGPPCRMTSRNRSRPTSSGLRLVPASPFTPTVRRISAGIISTTIHDR